MNCPNCRTKTKVKDSRAVNNDLVTYRRRSCLGCGYEFTTNEVIIEGDVQAIMEVSLSELSRAFKRCADHQQDHAIIKGLLTNRSRALHSNGRKV